MNKRLLIIVVLVIMVLIVGFVMLRPNNQMGQPEIAARDFYLWWLKYDGNPIKDKAHHQTDLLTKNFVAQIDKWAAGKKTTKNPVTLSNIIPERIEGTKAGIAGKKASLHLYQLFTGLPEPVKIKVDLINVAGKWKIDSVQKAK
jgi:hypothetical protein